MTSQQHWENGDGGRIVNFFFFFFFFEDCKFDC